MDEIRLSSNEPLERSVIGLHESLIPKLLALCDRDAAVLDVGSGTGAWLDRLARHGFSDLTGVDKDVDQVTAASSHFLQCDLDSMFDWPVPERAYRLITAIELIEHLSNIGHFLDQVKKLLDPNGFLLITTPNILSIAARMRHFLLADMKQFGDLGDQTHLFPVVLGTFPRLLERHDLELIECWGYPGNGETLTSRPIANFVTTLFRLFLREPIPGDVLCMLIRRVNRK